MLLPEKGTSLEHKKHKLTLNQLRKNKEHKKICFFKSQNVCLERTIFLIFREMLVKSQLNSAAMVK